MPTAKAVGIFNASICKDCTTGRIVFCRSDANDMCMERIAVHSPGVASPRGGQAGKRRTSGDSAQARGSA